MAVVLELKHSRLVYGWKACSQTLLCALLHLAPSRDSCCLPSGGWPIPASLVLSLFWHHRAPGLFTALPQSASSHYLTAPHPHSASPQLSQGERNSERSAKQKPHPFVPHPNSQENSLNKSQPGLSNSSQRGMKRIEDTNIRKHSF